MPTAVLLDLDGTLVDTSYHHALAWFRAFRRHRLVQPMWRVHRAVGMGGDQLVPALIGDDGERRHGDALRALWREEFLPLRDEIEPLAGAHELVAALREDGLSIVIASSAPQEDLDLYLDLIGVRDLVDAATTADDVEATKPEPDIVEVALERAGTRDAVLVGDAPWDCLAAGRAGIETVCVLTGGFSAAELREAGAAVVFPSLVDLREQRRATPLGAAVR